MQNHNKVPRTELDTSKYRSIERLVKAFEELPTFDQKQRFLTTNHSVDPQATQRLLRAANFDTLVEIVEENPSLDDIFGFLRLVKDIDPRLCQKLLFSVFGTDPDVEVDELVEKSLQVLSSDHQELFTSIHEGIMLLRAEEDERKIALVLTDLVLVNEEVANRVAWTLLDRFILASPKRFLDCLRIISWGNRDLLLIMSVAGEERLQKTDSLGSLLEQLRLVAREDPATASLLVSENLRFVDQCKKLVEQNFSLATIVETFQLIASLNEIVLEKILDTNINLPHLIRIVSQTMDDHVATVVEFLDQLAQFKDSRVSKILMWENFPRKSLVERLVENLDLHLLSDALQVFRVLDLSLAEETVAQIDPKLFAATFIKTDDPSVMAHVVHQIRQVKTEFLDYSLNSISTEIIKHLNQLIPPISNLELLAELMFPLLTVFDQNPQYPLLLTTVRKRLQRENDLDNLGCFFGMVGQDSPTFLRQVTNGNDLLNYLRLFSTPSLGQLLMTTSLYDTGTAIHLASSLSERFSVEPDVEVLRKAIETIALGSPEVARAITESEGFDPQELVHRLSKVTQQSCPKVSMALDTFHPLNPEIRELFLRQEETVELFLNNLQNESLPNLVKVMANSRWMTEELTDEVGRLIAEVETSVQGLTKLLRTGVWSNPDLSERLLYWTNRVELASQLEELGVEHPLVEEFLQLTLEIKPELADQLLGSADWEAIF